MKSAGKRITKPVVRPLPGQVLPVPMAAIARAPTTTPLSPQQYVVAVLVGIGYTYDAIVEELGITYNTVESHARGAAARIPGDLPTMMKLTIWARGGTLDVLEGHSLKYEIEVLARRPHGLRDTVAGGAPVPI